MVRPEFVFFENELIIDILDVGQVEVGFCYQQRGFCRVDLDGGMGY